MNTVMKKAGNFLIIILFLVVTAGQMLYWVSIRDNFVTYSLLEARELAVFPKITILDMRIAGKRIVQGSYEEAYNLFFKQFFTAQFQYAVNDAASDQFLFREQFLHAAQLFDWSLIKVAYAALPDAAIPVDTKSHYLVTRDLEYLISPVRILGDDYPSVIDSRIANYQALLEQYPQVNFYVFNVETLDGSAYHPAAKNYPDADNGRSLQYFLEHKPENLNFVNHPITSFEDYRAKFFRTDHHWNIRSAIQGYQEVYDMLSENYPDMSPGVEVKAIKKIENLEFLGTLARRSLFPVTPEVFEYADYELADYSVFVKGEPAINYSGRQNYLKGNFKTDKYFDHYWGFYGSTASLIKYHFDNQSDRNILLFVSSHELAIQEMIASHYRDTYILDYRFEENRALSLKTLIEQYQITDVLIIGHDAVTYFSNDYLIMP